MLTIQRRDLLLVPLLLAAIFAYTGAFLLRFDFIVPQSEQAMFRLGLCIFLPLKVLAYRAFRLHAARWRWAGMLDLYRVLLANMAGSAMAFAATRVVAGAEFPRSIYVLDAALCLLATAGIVIAARVYWEVLDPGARVNRSSKAILIYGAGTAGSMLGKEIQSNPRLRTKILGFLDDDRHKQGGSLIGIPILGAGRDAARIVADLARARRAPCEIIIAMPSATSRQMRAAIAHCRAAGVAFRTLPGLSELLRGRISAQVRDVSPTDLLGREPVRIDQTRIGQSVAGESVLVTGGCGSIGSELCRQLARFSPRKLVIFDQAESEMYMLATDLRRSHPGLNLVTEIGDIVRAARVKEALARHEITMVFHAAAYKHVPLMEEHIPEAVQNNVIGTYNVARWAHWAKVKKFILISTDKAVNPTSIMGVTKRVAEQIVSAIPLDGGPRSGAFVSVRFGNVLGSAGSVIPIFQRQIAAGGPVTVTHPEMRRYFMSISEAVQLVLQASTIGEGGEVFVLDMGEPVKIIDLAVNMVRLAGLTPGEDIEILVTGLRPGEKLYEELQLDQEDILPTEHEKIMRFRSQAPDACYIGGWLERLKNLLPEADPAALKEHLLLLVPEYQGTRHVAAAEEPAAPRVLTAPVSLS
jgi:FlaA1/EpsC-like NDP-sugar epimerase